MTITPWGDATELRSRRLRPGPNANRAAVSRNQLERMHAAMVAAVAENGYEATRVADVVKLSGVSRSAFYKQFEDKLDCFLATLDAVAELAFAELERHYDRGLPWEERLRGVADAFLDMLLEQPAAARLCLVEVYAAGPAAVERLDRAVARAELEVSRAFNESPKRRGMPRDVVRAIVGGVHKTVHTRLRRGEQVELIHELPELLDWALGYHAPPTALRRPRWRPDRGAAPLPDLTVARERLITAVTDVIAADGYPGATIVEIANRSSSSLSTFYGNFENKEEALLTALDRAREQSLVATKAATARTSDWRAAIRVGIDSLFGYFAAEPAAAKIVAVEAFTAGPEGLEGGDQTIAAFRDGLDLGCQGPGASKPLVAEAVGNAIYSLAYNQIRRDRTDQLRTLTPTATFVALAPMAGAARACAIANG
jgi:AcrR family transcriptional regulator